jgi:hypothetical protein
MDFGPRLKPRKIDEPEPGQPGNSLESKSGRNVAETTL